jgi:hypothetical protein
LLSWSVGWFFSLTWFGWSWLVLWLVGSLVGIVQMGVPVAVCSLNLGVACEAKMWMGWDGHDWGCRVVSSTQMILINTVLFRNYYQFTYT